MTSINYQNTWHSKESDLYYGPDTPSYYQAKFSDAKWSDRLCRITNVAYRQNFR